MRKTIAQVTLLLLICISGYQLASAQVFWQDDFESATAPDIAAGSTRTPENNSGFGSAPHTAYFKRTNGSDISMISSPYSLYSNTFFWAGEDHDTPFGVGNEEQQIEWTNINITGLTGLTFKGLFGANSTNASWDNFNTGSGTTGFGVFTGASNDYIIVEYAIGVAPYSQLVAFFGDDVAGAPGSAKKLREDTDGNFIGDGTILNQAMTEITKSIPGTGTSMKLRIRAYSNGTSEEWGMDNFRLSSTPACTPPSITCPGAQTLTLNSSCQATLPDYRSLATVTGPCSPTTTQSPAIGNTVSGPGPVTVSLFATNTSLQSSTCTFTVNTVASEIDVTGNSASIVDGDASPSLTDHTDFGSVNVGSNLVRTYTITNSGGANLTLAAGSITLSGTDAAQFAVGGITLPLSIPTGLSATFTVTFTPSSSGLKSATVNIASNDCNENPYDFAIQGTGVALPEINVKGNATSIVDGDATPSLTDHTDFGNVGVCSATLVRTFTVENTGGASLTISSVTITGTNAADFTVTSSPSSSVTAGSSTTFQVTFNPSGTGSRTATITINNNDADEAAYDFAIQGFGDEPEINLVGNSVSIVDGDGTPSASDHTDFGSVLACTGTIVRTFTIQNTGTASLTVSGVTVTGTNAADFTVTTAPSGTVAAAGSTTFQVTFDPSATGVRTATINVANNDCDEATYDFAVQGTGNVDAIAPAITCPANQSVNASVGVCSATATYVAPVGTDNCPSPLTTRTGGLASGASFPVGVTTNTFTVTDGTGNTATCSFTITVTDNQNPVITCPANQSVNSSVSVCSATVTYTAPVGTDNCSGPTTTQTAGTASGGTFPVGTTTNTFRVTDASGNTATCSFTVTVVDAEVPVLSTLACNTSTASGTAYNDGWQSGDNDGAGFGVWSLVASGSVAQSGFFVNSSTGNGAGTDTNADGDVNSGGRALGLYANSSQAAQATRPISGTFTVGSTLKSDLDIGFVDPGQLVGFQLQNSSGNSLGEVRFRGGQPSYEMIDLNGTTPFSSVTFTDEGITIEVTSISTGVASMKLTRKVNGATQTLPMALFPGGGNQVIARVMFFNSNAGSGATNDVYINNFIACLATPGCPGGVSTPASVGVCSAVVTYTAPTGSDNCSGVATTQTAGLASGATYPVGTTNNTFRATDGAGNTATCSFAVTVTDNQNPTITCPANQSVNTGAGLCSATVSYTAPTGADNCAGSTTTQTAGLANGASFPLGTTTNTFRVTDASGNTATCSFTVTVVDNQVTAPTCPSNQSLNAGPGTCSASLVYTTPTASDNCPGAAITQTSGLPSGGAFPVGTTTNIFRVTDAAGNTATCSFTVTVADNQNPTITCPANQSMNASVGVCSATVTYTAPVGTDNCSGPTTTQTAGLASGATYPVGTTTNTFRVTDAVGNTTTCSFTVTVADAQNPTITCPANQSVNASVGTCAVTATYVAPTGADNCTGSTTTRTAGLASGASFSVGVNTIVYRVTDASGNTATCSFNITVTDNQNPTITCPANQSVSATVGLCSATVTYVAPVGVDNCSGPTTTQTAGLASGATYPVGLTTNIFRVTDASGNTSTCSFTITVTDNQNPTITCPANQNVNASVGACSATVTYTAPVGSDNCTGSTTTQTAGLASGATYPVGATTNTFRVTDAAGNTTTCSFSVTVVDAQNPTITCPANQSVSAGVGTCSATATYVAPVGSDNCAGQTTVLFAGGASGSSFNVGVNTVQYRVTDASGNTTSCTFTITITDNENPTITCPANQSVNATVGACSAPVTYVAPVGADNCAGQTTVLFAGGASGSSFNVGVNTVQYRVTDASGNTASCTFTVTVTDNENPTITCPANQSVSASVGACSATATYTAPVGADNCAGQTTALVSGGASGSTFNVGVNTVQYRVTDASGNTASCTFTITVTDNENPTITCPANQSVSASVGLCSATATYTAPVGADNCAGQTTILFAGGASGSSFNVGVNTVQYRVTDASGNTASCTFTITVTDNENPTITCPANQSVSASVGACSATATYVAPVGSDNCPSPVTVLFSGGASGSTFNVGVNTVQYRVTDASGNTASCTFTVTVTDNQNPTITCPANISGNTDPGLCSRVVTYTAPVGTDNCAGQSTTQSAGLASGAAFPKGTTTNTFVVTDAAGNTSSCSFNVVVSDLQNPAITCPANQSVGMTVGQCSGTATYTAPVGTDNCPGQSTTQTSGIASGGTFPNGVTTNIFRVTDASGNTATCSFNVTVTDNLLPSITCPSSITTNATTGQCAAVVTYTAPVGTDNCPGANTSLTGGLSSGASFPVGTTTNSFRVTDAVGNTATCSFTVTVVDNQAPAITCPANIAANTDPGVCNAVVTYSAPVGSDNCSGASTTQIGGLASGATYPLGTTTNTFRVTAANGASTTCAFNVVVTDAQAPTAVCQNLTVSLNGSGTASITASQVNNGSSDNCGVSSVSINTSNFTCANVGTNTVILTVNDVNGNASTCAASVLVNDVTPPVAVCQNVTVNLNASGNGSITATQLNNGSTDACGIGTLSVSTSTFTCANVGTNSVTLTVSDVNGNTTTCTSTVLVRDLVAPTAICQNLTVNLNASGAATITAAQVNNGSSDACGIANLGLNASAYSCANVGVNNVVLTVTDVNSNTATCTATVTVRDITPPTAVCQNVTLNLNASGTGSVTASQVNNGSSDACGIGSVSVSTTAFTCANVGANNVVLTVTDVNANTATCAATVTVNDLIAPTAVCQNVTLNLNASGAGTLVPSQVNNGSSDACGIGSVSLSVGAFTCANVGNNTVVLTVTDVNSNTATCSSTVLVQDLVAPTALCHGVTTYLNGSGNASITASDVNNGSSDACGIGNVGVSVSAFTCANAGANTVILTVTDVNGNTATCTGNVQVLDTLRPVVSCQAVTAYLNAQGTVTVAAQNAAASSSDNCGAPTLSLSATAFSCSNVGSNTVVLTATDIHGNTATCSTTVTIADTLVPTLVLPPTPATVNSDSSLCGAHVSWGATNATDNCSIQSLTSNHTSGDVFPIGSTTVIYVATDNHGNSTSGSFVVTVNATPLALAASSPLLGCGYSVACATDSNATASAYVAGGCTPYSYAWSNGAITAATSGLAPGVHYVTITDAQQGQLVDSVTITAPSPLTLSFTGDTVVCAGNADGVLHAVVAGGQDCAAYSYAWSTGGTLDSISGLTSGTYGVTVTDNLGCSVSDSRTLGVGVLPVLQLGNDTIKCPGASLLFEAPPIYAAYLWSDGSNNSTIVITQTGTYTCQVWTVEGCTDTDTVVVSDYVVDYDIITAVGSVNICDGDTVQLVGDAGLSNYVWSTGATSASILVGGFGGVVSLTATDAHGCATHDSVTINYTPFTDPQPVIVPGPNAVLCAGGTLQLDVQMGYFAYAWSTGGSTQSITISTPGVYNVTVSNGFGCTSTSVPVTVSVGQLPTPTVTVGVSSLSTGSYAGYQWLLNGNPILGAITQTFTPVVSGNYSVVVTDIYGCSGTSSAVFFNAVGVAPTVDQLQGLELYPNPGRDILNLRTLAPIDWPVEVEVWDIYGKKVKAYDMAHLMDVISFDVSDLAKGSYLMKITTYVRNNTRQAVIKFVLQ